jgi:hypothetical protein
MKFAVSASFILFGASAVVATADQGNPTTPDDSMAHVLKADQFYDLAEELGDSSESGQNQAAILMANAKRIETEARISSKSMRRVMVLGEWRKVINDWNDLQLEVVWFWRGGGTMYYHEMWRNNVAIENTLARVAEQLPLTGKPVTKETSLKIDALLKQSMKRLAQAKAEIKRTGHQPPMPIESLTERLKEAHSLLKAQFRYAGDETNRQYLLDLCEEPTEHWK